jgi:hypothetical protein
MPCDIGDVCQGGACQCNATLCPNDNVCTGLKDSPGDCGQCGKACTQTETCANGSCACRAGLTSCPLGCVDIKRDGNNCGGCGKVCSLTERCQNGACQDQDCDTMGETNCNNGCYTQAQLDVDPLNCGQCGNECDTTQLCVGGQCVGYYTSPYCTSCPCDACSDTTTCCTFSAKHVGCVAGTACP